jgi:DnaA-homolog protein
MRAAQLPLAVRLRDTSVFESYFPGRNRSAVDALRALGGPRTLDSPAGLGRPPTCIWVHGATGVGKTHLLQATCARTDLGAAYVPLREVATLSEELLSGYGQFAVVCLDDAEAVAGEKRWEGALFRLHQELDEQGGRLLVSGLAPPAALGFKLRDLASRLNGGLVLTLHALDESEQASALQLRAQLRGFELPEETAQFLLRRLPRNMASLCAFLDELDQASLAARRRLTVPFVREVMEGLSANPCYPQISDQQAEKGESAEQA